MILVDTSVVVDLLRAADPRLLAVLQSQVVAICGITRAEVLHGIRNPVDHVRFVAALNAFQQAAIPDSLWDEVGLNLCTLRTAGVTVPLADVVIATLAIYLGLELWSRDQHFQLMQAVLPSLKLFAEPP